MKKKILLEWQPCHSPVMIFCLSRAIYKGFSQCSLYCTNCSVKRTTLSLNMLAKKSAIPCNVIIAFFNSTNTKQIQHSSNPKKHDSQTKKPTNGPEDLTNFETWPRTINITSFSSILYCRYSEYWPLKKLELKK